jgi:hypothetical protein
VRTPQPKELATHLNAHEGAVQDALAGLRARGYVLRDHDRPDLRTFAGNEPGYLITAAGKRALGAA